MNPKAVVSLLVVLLVAVSVESQRGDGRRRPGGRRQRPSLFTGDVYEWQLDLGSATLVDQKAFVNADKNVTLIITRDPIMPENNLTSSVALYHESGMVAIRMMDAQGGRRRGRGPRAPCFLTMTTLSFDDITADLIIRNGSEVALPVQEVTLNASTPLSRREAREVFKAIKPLNRFCRGRRVVMTTPVADGALDSTDSEVRSTVTLEGQINMILNSGSTFPRQGDRDGFPQNGNGFPRPGNGFPQNGNGFPRPGNGFPQTGNGFPRPRNLFPQNANAFPQQENGFPRSGSNIDNEILKSALM